MMISEIQEIFLSVLMNDFYKMPGNPASMYSEHLSRPLLGIVPKERN